MVVVGINLGTTDSYVAAYFSNSVHVLKDNEAKTTPSVVSFEGNAAMVGNPSEQKWRLRPENTIYDSTRFLGKRFSDPSISGDDQRWHFKVTEDEGKVAFKIGWKTVSPEKVISHILIELKSIAKFRLKTKVTEAVIAVPAYFNASQINGTIKAAQMAGLSVRQIISEPISACLAFGFAYDWQDTTVLVYDLGGSTFDVSIVKIKKNVYDVSAICGISHLGGRDFDQEICDHFLNVLIRSGNDISKDDRALAILKDYCVVAKEDLTKHQAAEVYIPKLRPLLNFRSGITRQQFERRCTPLVQKSLSVVKETLDRSGLSKHRIDEVILVGGSTRIPLVRQLLQEFFDGKTLRTMKNPEEAAAIGAALRGALMNGNLKVPTFDGQKTEHQFQLEQQLEVLIPRARLTNARK